MGHFLQITIARKTTQFLKKNYTNSRDRELQKRANYNLQITIARKTIQFLLITNCRNGPLSKNYDCKKNYKISREKLYKILMIANCRNGLVSEKLDHFSRKTTQFLVIANCRNGPLFANYDRKKNYTISWDRELQKRATFCKLRSQEKL